MRIETLRKQLPHGALKEITKRSKVSEVTVRGILNGKILKSTKKTIVVDTAIKFLEEQKKQDAQLSARFNEVVNYGTS